MPFFQEYRQKINKSLQFEREDTVESMVHEVLEGAKISSTNLWLLILGTIIGCVGLINNSISAIIGAMLMSPLMGPIVALGTGLAMQDRRIVFIAFKNAIRFIVYSLAVSLVFFLISPYKFLTDQISGFTQATLYDIVLAFAGGVAGFIGISKTDGAKILAGVAVATSCIPPLAVGGYGLVTLDWPVALGGVYYYLINVSFIALGTYVTALYFKLPKRRGVGELANYNRALWFTNLIFLLPALVVMYSAYQRNTLRQAMNAFVEKQFVRQIVLEHSYDEATKQLRIAYIESPRYPLNADTLKQQLAQSGYPQVVLDLHRTSEETGEKTPVSNYEEIRQLKRRLEELERTSRK